MRKIIKDDFGNDFIIEDQMIKKSFDSFSPIDGKADNSVHERTEDTLQ